jgi:peptidoglycan hydrolase-like protein with peptidoglycan-binding domain
MRIASGNSPVAIDGQPRVALATRVPLWRDLTLGTKGEDVRAIQSELDRLGFPLAVDGLVGASTLRAAERALVRAGIEPQYGVISSESVVWIPTPTATVSKCESVTGAEIAKGASMAVLAGSAPRATITNLPSELVPGDRLVVIGDGRYPVDPSGSVNLPADSPAVLGARAGESDGGMKPVEAQLVLADPVTVSVVAPSSIYGVQGADACVRSEGAALPVSILGFRLGQTLVRFSDGSAPEAVDLAPRTRTPCR